MNTASIKIGPNADVPKELELVAQTIKRFWDEGRSMLEIEITPIFGKATCSQNNMQFQWFKDAAEQSRRLYPDDPDTWTTEYWRAQCKAYCGVPILLRDDADFAKRYAKVVKPLPLETKLELMQEPFNFPVTQLMNKAQKSEYLDACHRRLTQKHGFTLTEPEERESR